MTLPSSSSDRASPFPRSGLLQRYEPTEQLPGIPRGPPDDNPYKHGKERRPQPNNVNPPLVMFLKCSITKLLTRIRQISMFCGRVQGLLLFYGFFPSLTDDRYKSDSD